MERMRRRRRYCRREGERECVGGRHSSIERGEGRRGHERVCVMCVCVCVCVRERERESEIPKKKIKNHRLFLPLVPLPYMCFALKASQTRVMRDPTLNRNSGDPQKIIGSE